MKDKTIMFIDLEGTILNEEDGKIQEQDLFDFIGLINQLEVSTESTVAIHLVSPVEYKIMKQIKDHIDFNIKKYNRQMKTDIQGVESAACNMTDESLLDQTDNTIVPLPTNISKDKRIIGLAEKAEYVKFWHQLLKNRYKIKNLIYIGNGRNDLQAMKYVKSQNGIAICPKNSRTKVREIADYTGHSSALKGVNEALNQAIKNNLQNRQICYGD